MLNSFRAFSGSIITKILMGLLILSFALWGVGDMLRTGGRSSAVATVGDVTISVEKYHRELAIESENVRRQLGASYSQELLKRLNVPQFVLQRMVQQSLLSQEAVRMGFVPDDVHVALAVRNNTEFQNQTGTFDKARFENALRSRGVSEKIFVEELRMQLAMDKLLDSIMNVQLPLKDTMLAKLRLAMNEGRVVSVYKLVPEASNAAPSDEALAAYHKEHASLFTAPEYRTVSFVQFSAKDAEAKAPALTDAAIHDYYMAHEDQFHTPEKREVEQLIYSSEDKANEAYEAVKLGKNFADIAASTSPLNKSALSLGLVDKKGIIEGAGEKVFALKAGGFTEPFKSAFGYHIFRVVKIEPEGLEPLEKVRSQVIEALKQSTLENAVTEKINHLEDALAGGSTLAEAAKTMGLAVEQAGTFDKAGTTQAGTAAAIPALDKFLDVAFKTEEKTESQVMSSKNAMYYVLRVDAVVPEKLRPLAEVKDAVINAYQQNQNDRASADLASKIEQEIAAKKSAAEIIAAHRLSKSASGVIMRGSKDVAGLALSTPLIRSAFSQTIGSLTSPSKDKQGDYMMLLIEAVSPAAATTAEVTTLSKDTLQQMQEEMMTEYLRYLETRTPVQVNTAVLDQLLKTSDAAN